MTIPIHEMTSDQATAALAELQRNYDARTAPPAPPDQPTNANEARAKLAALTADKSFYDKLQAGDTATVHEFNKLTEQVAADESASKLDKVLAGAVETTAPIETTTGDELTTRETFAAVADLRAQGNFGDKAVREIIEGTKMTAEQVAVAAHRKDRALRDPDFTKAYLAGEPAAVEAMTLWNAVLANGVKEDE